MMWLILLLVAALSAVYVLFRKKKQHTGASAAAPKNPVKLSPEAQQLKTRLGLRDDCKPITLSYDEKCSDGDLLTFTNAVQELSALYILCEVSSNEEEEALRNSLLARAPTLAPQRILYYSSAIGRMAIVRQVNPSVHIEHDLSFCEKLKPHVKKIVHINATANPAERAVPTTRENSAENSGGVSECGSLSSASSSCAAFPTVASLRHVFEIQLE
jgi:hypothetical protein